MDVYVGKRGATAIRVAPLRSSLSAEEAQKQLFFQALRVWEQRPNACAVLTVLQDGRE